MPKDIEAKYTAVTMTKTAKAALEELQVVLSAEVGRRLSYGETIMVAKELLRELDEDLPFGA